MNPDGTPDSNLFNFYGPQHDGTTQDLTATVVLTAPEKTGIIKATSNVHSLKVLADTVVGARETACDVNNGASLCEFVAKIWDVSACKYGFSIKGGACGNTIRGVIRGRSRECEVFLDNWSDQSHEPSSGNALDLRPEDGKTPIRVRYLLDKPIFAPGSGPYEFVFPGPRVPLPRWLVYKGFNELRRHPWVARMFGLT